MSVPSPHPPQDQQPQNSAFVATRAQAEASDRLRWRVVPALRREKSRRVETGWAGAGAGPGLWAPHAGRAARGRGRPGRLSGRAALTHGLSSWCRCRSGPGTPRASPAGSPGSASCRSCREEGAGQSFQGSRHPGQCWCPWGSTTAGLTALQLSTPLVTVTFTPSTACHLSGALWRAQGTCGSWGGQRQRMTMQRPPPERPRAARRGCQRCGDPWLGPLPLYCPEWGPALP